MSKLGIVEDYYLVASLINDVISITRSKVVDSPICFIANIDSGIPGELFGDEAKIRQAVIDVLGNAVKYTEEGFVSLTIRGETVDEDTINLVMTVVDSGKGIKEEDFEAMFGDFAQVGAGSGRDVEGIGLVLATTKGVIEAMGGQISVFSEYGEGSTFTITLPQKVREHAAMAVVEDPGISVLLYEENDVYADSIYYAVNNLGAYCEFAQSVFDFFKKLESQSYDFVFVSTALYEKHKTDIAKYTNGAKICLFDKFGSAVSDEDQKVLYMPVYCVPIANTLNNAAVDAYEDTDGTDAVKFSAPEAKVLVVDDVGSNLLMVKDLIDPYDIQVDLCKSGMDALEALRSLDYDLVFMDHKMPGMDGVETMGKIRELGAVDAFYINVPIVALTANAVAEARVMLFESGFDDFISKPIDVIELNTILEKWIPKAKQRKIST